MIEFYRDVDENLRVDVQFDLPVIAAGFTVILVLTVIGVFITAAF